jgi:hypothetical protein
MTRIVQHRRGTTSGLASILGAPGELFVDTSLVTVVVHDGVTTGGVTLARNADLTTINSTVNTVSSNLNTLSSNTWRNATTSILGLVKADGTGILINAGTISIGRYNTRATSLGTSVSSVTPDLSLYEQYSVSSQAATLTINAPIGTPVDGQKLLFRIIDNGGSQTLSWNSSYVAVGAVIPTATTAGKMTYVGCIYNLTNLRWDVIAVATQV